MKYKKIAATALASAMLFGSSLAATGCSEKKTEETTAETTAQTEVSEEETETETSPEPTSEEMTEETTEETTEVTTEGSTSESEDISYMFETVDIDSLETEELSDDKPVLYFHSTENYDKVLKTDLGLIVIPHTTDPKIGKIDIRLDDNEFELDCIMDNVGSTSRAYLVRSGGNTYIYTQSGLMDDWYALNVYKVSDGQISHVGSIEGIRFAFMASEFSPESFKLGESAGQGGAAGTYTDYKVGDDGMPVRISNTWLFDDYTYKVSFEEEKTGLLVMGGQATKQEVTIDPEEIVKFCETDKETFVDVQKENGDVVRLDITQEVAQGKVDRREYYDFFYCWGLFGIDDYVSPF